MKIQTDRFNELTKKEKIMVGLAGGCLIMYLYLSFVINPIMKSIDPLKKEVTDLKHKVSDLDNINIKIEELKESYKNKKKNYEKASSVLPKSDRYPQLIKEINENITKSSLQLVSITNTEGVSSTNEKQKGESQNETSSLADGLRSNGVSINVEGDYNGILNFIDNIERGSRIAVVSSIAISSESGKTVGNIIVSYIYGMGGEEESYNFNNGNYGSTSVF